MQEPIDRNYSDISVIREYVHVHVLSLDRLGRFQISRTASSTSERLYNYITGFGVIQI